MGVVLNRDEAITTIDVEIFEFAEVVFFWVQLGLFKGKVLALQNFSLF
jgi:hypothetical protein